METPKDNDHVYAIFKIDHTIINKNNLSKDRKLVSAEWLYSSRSIQNVRDRLSEILREYSSVEHSITCQSPEHYFVNSNKKIATLLSYTRDTSLLYEYLVLSLHNPKKN
jgi:hypothetical protein